MRLYVEVARRSFRRFSTYRGAMFAGFVTNSVFGFILVAVLRSVIGTRTYAGVDRDAATAYAFIAQALIGVVMMFGDFGLSAQVQSGEIAHELLRPWDWSGYRLASDLGRSFVAAITRGVATFGVGWAAYRFPLPPPARFGSFLLCVFAASVLASRLWTIVGVVAFWIVDATGVIQLAVSVGVLTSGLSLPLRLFPDAIAHAFARFPFAGMVHRPAEVFLGRSGLATTLLFQLLWIAVLEGVLRVELRTAVRRLVLQGG